MKFGISIPPFAEFANVRYLAEVARDAENAGWDGFFLWDHVFFDPSFYPNTDPWVALGAIAMTTSRMRIGTLITPLARRRPWIVARQTVSVDWASVGRFTLGVGLGDPVQWDFGFFHEDTDPRHRASKLDESLDIIQKLWTGEMVSHKGENYQLEPMQFLPKPVDRIPIWVGGNYPKRRPMLRAARYDGFYPLKWTGGMQPADWRDTMDYIRKQRAELGKTDAPFDVVNGGRVPEDRWHAAESVVAPYAEVGVNWWIEDISPWRFGLPWEKPWTADFSTIMHDAIRRGAPKL